MIAPQNFRFDDKHVVVIGGASGIGHAIVIRAKQLGAHVTIASRSPERTVATLGNGSLEAKLLNISEEEYIPTFFTALGPVDHIAVTAGDWGGSAFAATVDINLREARKTLDVRFWGSLAVAKFGAANIKSGGSIVLTGGMLSHRPAEECRF